MTRCFERPAFTTPLSAEVSFPHFEKAITDTIEALNTGVWRLRDGTEIARIACRFDIENSAVREDLKRLIADLVDLRKLYCELSNSGGIQMCECPKEGCTILNFNAEALRLLTDRRQAVLRAFQVIKEKARSGVNEGT